MKKLNHWDNHKQAIRWNRRYSLESANYLVTTKFGKKCLCCGKPYEELGHIVFFEDIVRKDRSKGEGIRTGHIRESQYSKMLDAENGILIPICHSCNSSMGITPNCRKHQKYLGIWNYLPKLYDLN